MDTFKNILLFALLLVASCKADIKKSDEKVDKPKEGKPLTVDAIIATDQTSENRIKTSGTIMANEEVEVKSEVAGKIKKIFFKEGAAVSKGQLLVKLDDDDLQAQYRKMIIEVKLNEDKENRQKQLLASTAISKEEYEITQTNVLLTKANMEILKTQIDKTRITAPFGGFIGLKSVSEGAIISSNTIIASIQNINPLKLEFNVSEKHNAFIKNGTPVTFMVTGIKTEQKATVYAKEPKIDPVTRTTKVRATFPNSSGNIFPGSFAEINVVVGTKSKTIMIPSVAFIPDISGPKIFVYKQGKAVSIPVKSGLRTEKEVEILDGLQIGDTVLTSGILQLKPNMAVSVRFNTQSPVN